MKGSRLSFVFSGVAVELASFVILSLELTLKIQSSTSNEPASANR